MDATIDQGHSLFTENSKSWELLQVISDGVTIPILTDAQKRNAAKGGHFSTSWRLCTLYAAGATNRATGELDAVKFGLCNCLRRSIDDNPIKTRIQILQTANPDELTPLAVTDWVDIRVEKIIHSLLHRDRIRGEWFQVSPRTHRVIEAMKMIADRWSEGAK